VDEIGQMREADVELVGRAGVGAGSVRVHAEAPIGVAAIEHLRRQIGVVGNVVVQRASSDVKEKTDVWGLSADTANLLKSIKQALDPAGVLGAGRGPIGLTSADRGVTARA